MCSRKWDYFHRGRQKNWPRNALVFVQSHPAYQHPVQSQPDGPWTELSLLLATLASPWGIPSGLGFPSEQWQAWLCYPRVWGDQGGGHAPLSCATQPGPLSVSILSQAWGAPLPLSPRLALAAGREEWGCQVEGQIYFGTWHPPEAQGSLWPREPTGPSVFCLFLL